MCPEPDTKLNNFLPLIYVTMITVLSVSVRNPIMLEIARLEKESKMEEMQKEKEEALSLQKKLQEEANKV